MRFRLAVMLLFAACEGVAAGDLQVGEWYVSAPTIEREAARRRLERCPAAEALAEEELIRLEYCTRTKHDPSCSGAERARALAAAIEDAIQNPTGSEVAAVATESRFLEERQPQEPGLARKLAERRATRAVLQERAQEARRVVPVRLPEGCGRSRPVAAR